MSRRMFVAALGCVVLLAGSCALPNKPVPPDPNTPAPRSGSALEPAPLDCPQWRYDGLTPEHLPPEFGDDHKATSARDPGSAASPHRLCGQIGAATDLAWNITTGRPDVLIAVIDSGIKWHDKGVMADLATKAHLNRGELPEPAPAGTGDAYDRNGDGSFDVSDYAGDPRVADANRNGLLDPEDLIVAFSDHTDADGNSYVDDISGWDVLNDDNNPLDDVHYGHGSGEARDSTAAHNGTGDYGVCARCQFLPVRVSDSFIAEGGRFAASVLFALDSGANVVQEALGAVSNPPQVQQAIDAAYRRGVPVVASMADEESQHANLPAALTHTIPVNSLTMGPGFLADEAASLVGRRDSLAVNGCTNIGAIVWVSVPSDSCSSEATGKAAGMVGLIESAARDAGVQLSANEVAQVLRASADDVDFSTPNAVDPANETVDDLGQQRFPTVTGWDSATGYGRTNTYEAVKAVRDGNIPPEADLTAPGEFELAPVSGTMAVAGRVAADRSSSYSYRVEWTTGLQTPPWPARDDWHVAGSATGLTAPTDGELGRIDLATVAATLPDGGHGTPSSAGRPDPDRFTVRVRVVVTDAEGRVGTMVRHLMVHDDPELRDVTGPGGLGTSSPAFADLDADGHQELVVAGDDGRVHALRPDGSELPGFPVSTPVAPYWHSTSPAAVASGIPAPGSAVLVGAPAVADLDGDNAPEIVVTTVDGDVMAWHADGSVAAHMHSNPAFSTQSATNEHNRLKPGFVGAPVLGDLDGDGRLDIVAAAADRHVYAWHGDGSPMAGFPVLLVDPAKVGAVDPVSHEVTFAPGAKPGIGGELVATPAVADLDGDGRPEIVVGAQEQYDEGVAVWPGIGVPGKSGNSRVYALSPRGTLAGGAERNPAHPDEQAYLPGWPVKVPMVLSGVLPTIGDGVATQAAIGDVDGDGHREVVTSSASGQLMVFGVDGRSPYQRWSGLELGLNWLNAAAPGSNSTDTAMVMVAFGGPALGHLGSAKGLDVAAPTTGLGRALDTLLSNKQPGDPQLSAWSGSSAAMLPGFPRVTADLAFFVTPAVADVDGDGRNEVVAGNGVQTLDAFSAGGTAPATWPKLTGGWVLGTPGLGDWDGDGRAEVAVTRRDGRLLVWNTPTAASAVGDWIRFGANTRNDGSVG